MLSRLEPELLQLKDAVGTDGKNRVVPEQYAETPVAPGAKSVGGENQKPRIGRQSLSSPIDKGLSPHCFDTADRLPGQGPGGHGDVN